jgi:hypothetical protein
MSSPDYRIRRATVEDLEVLRTLWEAMRIPAAGLEKRVTEFQVAEGPDGRIVGALGFLMAARNGWIHSEAYSDFGVADIVQPLFWARLQVLSANHGVFRVWTLEEAPFWKQNGLRSAMPDALTKLPPGWGEPTGPWLTLQLKNEEAIASVEKEVNMLMMTEKERTKQALEKAKQFKKVFIVVVFTLILLFLALAIYVFFSQKGPR